jgi:hypothetical protein
LQESKVVYFMAPLEKFIQNHMWIGPVGHL